ncbi:hypothetical protein T12_4902, partial [Trichinella patagoniensis]
LVYEGRAHLLKHTNFDEKQWISRVKSGCRSPVYTNLEVNTVLRTAPHAEHALPTIAYCIKWRRGTLLNAAQWRKRSQCRRYITKNAAMHPPA